MRGADSWPDSWCWAYCSQRALWHTFAVCVPPSPTYSVFCAGPNRVPSPLAAAQDILTPALQGLVARHAVPPAGPPAVPARPARACHHKHNACRGSDCPRCRALPRMPGHAACRVAWPDAWRGLHKLRLLLQGCARGAGRCVVPNKQIARSATTTQQLPSHTPYEKAESLHAAHRAVRRVIQPCVRTACYGINCRSLLAAAFHTAQHQLRSSTAVSTGRRLYWYVQCTAWWGQSSQRSSGAGTEAAAANRRCDAIVPVHLDERKARALKLPPPACRFDLLGFRSDPWPVKTAFVCFVNVTCAAK